MNGLLHVEGLKSMPAVEKWLAYAETVRRILLEKYPERSGEEQMATAVEENVLVQLENLRTHPAVASALACGKLRLHGWVYKFETGEVFSYDTGSGQFLPLEQAKAGA
jgi:carbonic anhydrase